MAPTKKRNPVYEHFSAIEGDDKRMQCNYCSTTITKIPSNLETHLKTQHKSIFNEHRKRKERLLQKRKAGENSQPAAKQQKVVPFFGKSLILSMNTNEDHSKKCPKWEEDTAVENFDQRKKAKLEKVDPEQRQESRIFGKVNSTQISDCETEENSSLAGDSTDAAIKLEEYELNPQNGHMEFILVPGQPTTSELSKEEKFIQSVYPQFTGKTKLQLIDQILVLQEKNKSYESTINRLINN